MSSIPCNKLIRDKIPETIERSGKKPIIKQPVGQSGIKYILGVDAAWTAKEPSGVALLEVGAAEKPRLLKYARSYEEFLSETDWNLPAKGSEPDFDKLFEFCNSNGWDVNVIALDIPLSLKRITGRRVCDNLISKHYGKYNASTHSPNTDRPGPVSEKIFSRLSGSFVWEGKAEKAFIEVYPHVSIIELFGYKERLKYKVQKTDKYWPELKPEERRRNIVANLNELRCKLAGLIDYVQLPYLDAEKAYSKAFLKGYEDVLDALVCAITGFYYLNNQCIGYGDTDGSIWVPG